MVDNGFHRLALQTFLLPPNFLIGSEYETYSSTLHAESIDEEDGL